MTKTTDSSVRSKRKSLIGVVVSNKMAKTATVLVETYKKHPIYKKRIKYSKKYHAHDENQVAKIGDWVKISETRPISATKRFYVVEVVKHVEDIK
ncbi:MAG: 30S ribosomal protein S17 [Mycoplasma sp.]